jgi:hypothetical protein
MNSIKQFIAVRATSPESALEMIAIKKEDTNPKLS